jgi:hypothetical protein
MTSRIRQLACLSCVAIASLGAAASAQAKPAPVVAPSPAAVTSSTVTTQGGLALQLIVQNATLRNRPGGAIIGSMSIGEYTYNLQISGSWCYTYRYRTGQYGWFLCDAGRKV